jgi:hypothetical protein
MARLAFGAAVTGALLQAPVFAGPKRCDWHGPRAASGESSFNKCIDYGGMQGKTVELPSNVTRISQDGISFCENAINTGTTLDADIVYMMDNSGSMKDGDVVNGVKTSPGDPNGIRDQVIRRAMRQQRGSTNVTTAGFLSFVGLGGKVDPSVEKILGPEAAKLQHPIDISRVGDPNETNLKTLLHKVWKYAPSEAANAKVAVSARTALTYWTDALTLAVNWLSPDSNYAKTSNRAIILVSDGAISDMNQVLALVGSHKSNGTMPPVFGIHLGDSAEGKHLKELSETTNGRFFVVNPTDTAVFYRVMQNIIGIITKNPIPKDVRVVNKTVSQESRSTGVAVNPDGSMGVTLDSIVGLDKGANQIEIQVTRDDDTKQTFNFTLNVAGKDLGGSQASYTCYEMPTLQIVDDGGKVPEIYSPGKTTYTVELTRSPSELDEVGVNGSSESGDKEVLILKEGNGALGYISQDGKVVIDPTSGAKLGNGALESSNQGTITLTWTHPRDARETVTFQLPGRKVPIVDGSPQVKIDTQVVIGKNIYPLPGSPSPIVVIDHNGGCVLNCSNAQQIIDERGGVPSWTVAIRGPMTYRMRLFDHLGEFVNDASGQMSQADFDRLPKNGDSAVVQLLMRPYAKDGQMLGTGAYLMRFQFNGQGDKVVTNSKGETILVKSAAREYFKRFGYIRPGI